MVIDFSDTNKLIDKVKFYVEFDMDNEDDIELISQVIREIKNKKILNENGINN